MVNNQHLWPDTLIPQENDLTLAGLSLTQLVKQFGTPLYLMDEVTVRSAARQFIDGFASYAGGASVYYACKALLNLALVQLLAEEGLAFDVVSQGELQIVTHAGVGAGRCHLHGNAKPVGELEAAVAQGIGRIVIDNFDEIDALTAICQTQQRQQQVLLRIVPDVVAGGNQKIQTGKSTSKFGFNIADGAAIVAIERVLSSSSLELVGLHAHTGSQIHQSEPVRATLRRLYEVADMAYTRFKWQPAEMCVGGGLGVPTSGPRTALAISDYCDAIIETAIDASVGRGWPLPHLSIEPGRSIVSRAVMAVYAVTGNKRQEGYPDFLHVDGGLGDNLRPAMYGATYDAVNVFRPNNAHTSAYQLAGRYCESGDLLIPKVMLPPTKTGDLIALPAAGAYTLSMASNYNGVGRPPLILLGDGQARIIQRRETWEDIILRDSL